MSSEDQNKLSAYMAGSDAVKEREIDVLNCGITDVDSHPSNSECKQVILNGSDIGSERDNQCNLVDDVAVEVHPDAVKDREVDGVNCGHTDVDSQPRISNSECEQDVINASGIGSERDSQCNLVDGNTVEVHSNAESEDMSISSDSAGQSTLEVNLVTETTSVLKSNCFANHVSKGISVASQKVDDKSISGLKRRREAIEEHQPSVHINYNNLTRASKNKLEELLSQWSEWHAQHVLPSPDLDEILESGEETFFPALVDLEKGSAVSFWLDNNMSQQSETMYTLDGNSVPLYDRGYALGLTSIDGSSNIEGGLKIIADASRCFNCGSYNHSLRECPKPRDKVAVNNARKQLKARRNQNPSSRNPARYYQNSTGGKFDGLRPGVLYSETRKVLGLGELDPPPWLRRMREIGYPPGYLDDEDQPSGITIYGDEEVAIEQEEGEIIDTDYQSKPKKIMTVEFPGINAPIPENANEKDWEVASSSTHPYRGWSQRKWNSYSDEMTGDHYREKRWSKDSRDDGPPGDPGQSSAGSSFYPQYSSHDSSYASGRRSPYRSRYQSDKSRRSPFRDEVPFTPVRFFCPKDYGSARDDDWNS